MNHRHTSLDRTETPSALSVEGWEGLGDEHRGFGVGIPLHSLEAWALAMRLLTVASDELCTRRRLEFLASSQEPLLYDDKRSLSALRALLAQQFVAQTATGHSKPLCVITPAGAQFRASIQLRKAL